MKQKILILLISLFIFGASELYPQAGQLDPTFGRRGIANALFNLRGSGQINSIAIQPDGKIVAAGTFDYGTKGSIAFTFTRYDPDGSLDRTFGESGYSVVYAADTYSEAHSVQIMPGSGDIIASGTAAINGHNVFSLVHLTSEGDVNIPDSVINIPIGSSEAVASSVVAQEDGKIIAVGYAGSGTDQDFALARFSGSSLDTTFGSDGIVITPVGISLDEANSAVIESDGKIIAAGYSFNGSNYDFALVRYNTTGSIDSTFGTNGIVTTPIGTFHNAVSSIAIQEDGKIVAGGYAYISGQEVFALARYSEDGSIDSIFGANGDGTVVTPIGTGYSYIKSVMIRGDGKIVAAGTSNDGSGDVFTVVCYNEDGNIDGTFGTNGIITMKVGSFSSVAKTAIVQPDGKVVVGGSYSDGDGSDYDFALVRYDQDGNLDNTFGINGIITTPIGTTGGGANSVVIQSDGKIVAAGYSWYGGNSELAIVRYNTDGYLDNAFGDNGIITTLIGTAGGGANSVAIQSDGKIVAAGYSRSVNTSVFATVRYNTNGDLDNTFGKSGIVITPIDSLSGASSMAIQKDGKIVAVGYSIKGNNSNFVVVRYNENGNLDNTFGTGGIVTGPFILYANAVAIQSDGKIIVAGVGSSNSLTIARYNTSGELDSSFGVQGIVTTQINSTYDEVESVAIQSDGKIVAVGHSRKGGDDDFALARYNENGSLDNTFGIVTTPIGIDQDEARSVAIQSNGKIVVAGYYWERDGYKLALARYNVDGSLDNTFGTNGIVLAPQDSLGNRFYSVAIQTDGKIVAAGFSVKKNYSYCFTLVRYTGDTPTAVSEEYIETPSTFVLEQNYPNPFNPTTSIRFVIPKSSFVNLKVYDILGGEVETLVNENKGFGYYKVNFDGSSLASGMYIYRLVAGNYVSTKKMLLIK